MAESLLCKCVSCCKKMGGTRLETETVSARRRRGELLCKYQERQRLQLGCVRASKQVSATCLPHLMSSLCRTSDSLMGAAPSRLMYNRTASRFRDFPTVFLCNLNPKKV